jgi:hypothetical protein
MTQRKALETRGGNCEITPQALSPIAKSPMKRDEPRAPTAIHCPLGITYLSNKYAIVIANCLENQFTSHDLCDENHERRVETRALVLSAYVDSTPFGKIRPCDIHKLENTLKLRKACGVDGIPNECLLFVGWDLRPVRSLLQVP